MPLPPSHGDEHYMRRATQDHSYYGFDDRDQEISFDDESERDLDRDYGQHTFNDREDERLFSIDHYN